MQKKLTLVTGQGQGQGFDSGDRRRMSLCRRCCLALCRAVAPVVLHSARLAIGWGDEGGREDGGWEERGWEEKGTYSTYVRKVV